MDPPITIGLHTDQAGLPLLAVTFEGGRAETPTMLPVIQAFMTARQLPDVTVAADAGMISEAAVAGVVGPAGRAGIFVAGVVLHVAQRGARVQGEGDRRVPW